MWEPEAVWCVNHGLWIYQSSHSTEEENDYKIAALSISIPDSDGTDAGIVCG